VLLTAVQGISDLRTVPGLINVDFADVRTIMSGMGRALMGTGIGTGKRRATEAAETAISSPLLEDVSIDGATGILINITGGPDLTLHEVNEASSLIQAAAHEDANIIFGSVIDPNLSEEVRITVIATGFERAERTQVVVPEMPRSTYQAPTAPPPPKRAATTSGSQVALPYDVSTVITKEYASPPAPMQAQSKRAPAHVIDEPEIDVEWEDAHAHGTPVDTDAAPRLAHGSGPAPVEGAPLIQPADRKRAQSRPSMKAVLAGEVDNDSELDVPTFIRRHNAHS
jgi:cell division protein FtsZ